MFQGIFHGVFQGVLQGVLRCSRVSQGMFQECSGCSRLLLPHILAAVSSAPRLRGSKGTNQYVINHRFNAEKSPTCTSITAED